jgi:dephospho-CoA kinase
MLLARAGARHDGRSVLRSPRVEVYGLTGGIGTGKTAVAELLEQYGVPVVSADELARIVVARGSDGLQAVVDAFGSEVLDEHGELDRRKMAAIVFQDTAQRQKLEAILHPKIRERYEQVLDALEKAGHHVAVYEVPLLFEKNLQGDMKAVILVTAELATRIARVRARDDVTDAEVRARMAAQLPEDQKRRRADYVIVNDGSYDELRREVEFMIARFLRLGRLRPARAGQPRRTTDTQLPSAPATPTAANEASAANEGAAANEATAANDGAPSELMPPGGTGPLFDYPPARSGPSEQGE